MVTDANIWIDLVNAGLARQVFELGEPLITPDFVLEELRGDADELLGFGLEIVSLDGSQIEELRELVGNYVRCSTPDLASLVVAREKRLILLTGDGALRDAAEELCVEVHGVLWVLDRLVGTELIAQSEARVGLERIIAEGAFLPPIEVQRRLVRWGRE
ncbi:MAG: type II toxin-antitoxin system VapC family toxin [Anaerolineales bacterium]